MLSNVDVVRALWRAFERGDVDAVARYADPQSEWRPTSAGGRVLHGPGEVREHMRALAGAGVELHARLDAVEEMGPFVLVSGSLRVERFGALSESTMTWSYRMRDGRVVCARAFSSRAQALAFVRAAAASPR